MPVTLKTPAIGLISLQSGIALKSPRLKVDRDKRIISGVSIIEAGPALGHGFNVDGTMLGQVASLINGKPKGIKSRLTHPGIPDCGGRDGIDVLVGRAKNAVVMGDQVFGDVHFANYVKKNPAGDLGEYLMSIAEEDPEVCGLSIVFDPAEFEEKENPDYDEDAEDSPEKFVFGRAKDVTAADFVGDPAANAGGLTQRIPGLLSRLPLSVLGAIPRGMLDQWVTQFLTQTNDPSEEKPPGILTFSGVPNMDAKLLGLLVAIGLSAANPTAEQAKQFLLGLDASKKAMLRQLCGGAGISVPPEAIEPVVLTTVPMQTPPTLILTERERILQQHTELSEDITRLANVYKLDQKWVEKTLGTPGMDLKTAANEAQKALAEKNKPVVTVGPANEVNGLNEAISDSLILRSRPDATFFEMHQKLRDRIDPKEGMLKRDIFGQPLMRKPAEQAHNFVGLRLTDLCRVYFSRLGLDVNELGPTQLATLAFDRPRLMTLFASRGIGLSEGIGDLPGVLVDAINKSLRIAYAETESTWEVWMRRGTAQDFKNIHSVQLSAAPTPQAIPTGAEYTRGYFKDNDQQTALQVYGKIIGLYRQTLINDDKDVFGRIPMSIGSACRRLENDLAYYLFTLNSNAGQTMSEDGNALFHTAHNNLAGSGLALSVGSLGTAKSAMRRQTALAAANAVPATPKAGKTNTKAFLNLIPRFLLLPTTLETIGDQLTSSKVLIANNAAVAGQTQNQGEQNPVAKWNLQTVVEPRLDDISSIAWYLAASPSQIDTAAMYFLEGEPEPVLLERDGWNIDGRDYKYRHTLQPVFEDYRGVYKNPGA